MVRPLTTALALSALWFPSIQAQTDLLIEVDTGRSQGIFSKSPATMRAILSMPDARTETALLFFRGSPGISRIASTSDKNRNLIPFLRTNQAMILNAGIALVTMDCPTDEWGVDSHFPTACLDDYRSSKMHADDVRAIMAHLKTRHGLSRFYILGHSYGTVSSRWLARNLGNDIAGSIHSSSMNVPNKHGSAASIPDFDYSAIPTPGVHVHHAQDACSYSPYAAVKGYAAGKLMSVIGGEPEGDVCGGKHFHSYRGREALVVRAMIHWINTGEVTQSIGE